MMKPITFVGGPLHGFRFRDLDVDEPRDTYDVPHPGDDSKDAENEISALEVPIGWEAN